jgi:hypothetical protein
MEDSFQFIIESPQHNTGHKKRPRLVTSCDNWSVSPLPAPPAPDPSPAVSKRSNASSRPPRPSARPARPPKSPAASRIGSAISPSGVGPSPARTRPPHTPSSRGECVCATPSRPQSFIIPGRILAVLLMPSLLPDLLAHHSHQTPTSDPSPTRPRSPVAWSPRKSTPTATPPMQTPGASPTILGASVPVPSPLVHFVDRI